MGVFWTSFSFAMIEEKSEEGSLKIQKISRKRTDSKDQESKFQSILEHDLTNELYDEAQAYCARRAREIWSGEKDEEAALVSELFKKMRDFLRTLPTRDLDPIKTQNAQYRETWEKLVPYLPQYSSPHKEPEKYVPYRSPQEFGEDFDQNQNIIKEFMKAFELGLQTGIKEEDAAQIEKEKAKIQAKSDNVLSSGVKSD